MVVDTIVEDFRKKVCAEIRLSPEGINRYRVFTPFLFEDGDHLAIVLAKKGDRWLLSDEGHTYMHLTYDLEEKDLHKGTRAKVISNALNAFEIEDHNGELMIPVRDRHYGDALYSFVQALLKIADVSYLSRERVRTTFMDDFREYMEKCVPSDRRHFDWSDPQTDPEGKYVVDCRVMGVASRPLLVYALLGDDKVRDATIGLLHFERIGLAHRSLAVFENQEEVNRKVLARFSDVCEKQYSSLAANKDRLGAYLKEVTQAA